MELNQFAQQISKFTIQKIPYFFLIDFEMKRPFVCKLEEAQKNGILYHINEKTNAFEDLQLSTTKLDFQAISPEIYTQKINQVIEEIKKGNSFLLNLTFPTPITSDLNLLEVFYASKAPYKLWFKDEFVVFSPESFIQIENNQISTYPMKGTIDATVEDAQQHLLNNEKEAWEHNTIVDLMRNDLAMISNNVRVEKFRYIEEIKTHKGDILQTSSMVVGDLPLNWEENFGENLLKLLPAGSISGAPKKKTVEIIQNTEEKPRGFYTGVFGLFDGKKIDSAVAIRFIERKQNQLFFRSGGGITAMSEPQQEYEELIQKIYLPIK